MFEGYFFIVKLNNGVINKQIKNFLHKYENFNMNLLCLGLFYRVKVV